MNGERKTTFLLTGDLEGIGVLEETLNDPQQKADCTKKQKIRGMVGFSLLQYRGGKNLREKWVH